GNVISLNQQIRNFEEVTLPVLEAEMGFQRRELLPKYLFVVGAGGNDYSFNYFLRKSNANVSLEAFTANLTRKLSGQLQKLYSLGGRKFALMAVNPIGCSPMVMANRRTRNGCIQGLNKAAHLFNAHLKSLVDVSKQHMPGSDVVFVNSYKMIRDIIKNPVSRGFKDTNSACCEVMSLNEGGNGILCKKEGQACEDRNIHVFFDGLHPTEAVNIQIATKAYNSNLKSSSSSLTINYIGGVPIWTAGNAAAATMVDSKGFFQFLSSGNLRLLNGSGTVVWNSNTTRPGVTTASLNDFGNLVLKTRT
ncbi:hypothetical protein D5086_024882, partial [Populus alba]